jgi:molecular chaperone DnaJ
MQAKDYYKILGVSEQATAQEIKAAYRNLAKKYHPDVSGKESDDQFKAISEAYDVLGDPQKKAKYDQMRKYGFGTQGFNPRDFDFGPFHRTGQSNGPGGFTFESIDLGDLGSIFSQFFGGAGPFNTSRTRSADRKDLRTDIWIPIERAVLGGNIHVTVNRQDTCPACEGGGAKPGSTVVPCPQCHGQGTVSRGGLFLSAEPCPRCSGKGQIIKNPCDRCQGKGIAGVKKTYAVQIPAGISDGEQIRLKGQGDKSPSGGPPGNLILTVRIKADRFFKTQGRHVNCSVQIDARQAEHGTTIQIRTPHGKRVRLKIPAGITDGTTLRIPNMGLGQPGKRGDQRVTVQVKKTGKKAENKAENRTV